MRGFETKKDVKHIIACFMRQYKELGHYSYCSKCVIKNIKSFKANLFNAQKTNEAVNCYGVIVAHFWGMLNTLDYVMIDNTLTNIGEIKAFNSSIHFLKAIQANKNIDEKVKKIFFEKELDYMKSFHQTIVLPKKYYDYHKDIIDKTGFKFEIKK